MFSRQHLLVPVLFRDLVQVVEHDGQDLVYVLLDQTQNVLVVPKIQRPFRHLHNTIMVFSLKVPVGTVRSTRTSLYQGFNVRNKLQNAEHEKLATAEIILVCSYLKMRASYTLGDLFKQQLLNLLKLCRLNDVQNLLDFAQVHDLHT